MDLTLFIRYDFLLGVIVLVLDVVLLSFFVIKKNELTKEKNNFNTPTRKLNLLADKPVNNGKSLLYSLTLSLENNNTSLINKDLESIRSIISYENKYEYKFSDISKEEIILIDTRTKFKNKVFSSTKTVNRHVFELNYYLK